MSFAGLVQEARRVAAVMGTWVVHEAARAESHAELVGFLRYSADGFEQQRARLGTRATKQRAQLTAWIVAWRKATRWLLSIEPAKVRAIAAAVLPLLADEPYYRACGHPFLEEGDAPPRGRGRPRVRALPTVYRECSTCGGFGWA